MSEHTFKMQRNLSTALKVWIREGARERGEAFSHYIVLLVLPHQYIIAGER